MRDFKFKIHYQQEDTGRLTFRIVELGEPIPHLGNRLSVIDKCQFVGMKDMDGKNIYENDNVVAQTSETEKSFFRVGWDMDLFKYVLYDGFNLEKCHAEFDLYEFEEHELKVNGSIHENKEVK